MENLKYIIEDKTIVQLLGAQNFTNKESAMLELVKNSYDAQATKLSIEFKKDELIIQDNGNGMNKEDIKKHWMHIGKSDKDYKIIDKDNNVRILSGSKGIGRFALCRLGDYIELISKKNDFKSEAIIWKTDWNNSALIEEENYNNEGTRIVIKKLRDKWNKINIVKLAKYLETTYNDDLMEISIIWENEVYEVKKFFEEPRLGYNCTSILKLNYIADKAELHVEVKSDEFNDEANLYCEGIDLKYFFDKINIFNELVDDRKLNLEKDELIRELHILGDFSAELYFSLKSSLNDDLEKFCYKYKTLPGRYEGGVILYRNSFSISSFEGTKDWLELGRRARISPAAATHPTGSWRVRENQLSGKVIIDKKRNYMLVDLANRQGLDENIFYEIFVKVIDKGISSFERYRQNIIRKINKKNSSEKPQEKNVVDKVINNPNIIKKLSSQEVIDFITEVKEYKKENIDYKREISTNEKRYKYDVRVLNVLATSGLKATSIAHEMQNDRNSILENCNDIIEAMKAYDIWDFVNEPERTKYAYANIPELINKNKDVNTKIISFMNTMLEEVEKGQFIIEEQNISELLNDIKSLWERDYSWIDLQLNVNENLSYILAKDMLKVILDNLILNSIQQNEEINHLKIEIEAISYNNLIKLLYKDHGKGLNDKYISNPMKILEVHETSRKQGHGLGMWIVNNTINMSGGEIKNIEGDKGFKIEFTIGGKV